ncbi:Phosphoethanolamine transferase EptC [Pseudomonas sp. Teo4]|nr:Phosphoethanolamine transferase EptC [Pseudomonas sp. Teo4]
MPTSEKAPLFSLHSLKSEWPTLVLWSYLLSPLVIRAVANQHHSKIDLLTLFTLGISGLWLVLLRFISSNQFKVHALLLPFYLLATIDLFLVLNFNSRLTAAYVFIALTNYKEASDFVATYWRPVALVLSLFALCYGLGLAGLYKRRFYKSRALALLSACTLLLGYGAYFYKTATLNGLGQGAVLDLAAKDQSTPFGYLSQIGLTTYLHAQSQEHISKRRTAQVNIISQTNEPNVDTLVFVIGESSRPHNWSLYGYHNPTTPNLDRQKGVFRLDNVCTTSPYTSVAVPSMLSLSPISNWDLIASSQSLVGIYRKAGYDTHWLSVQEVDSFGGIIPHIAAEAQHRHYFERSYDHAMLPAYEKILLDGGTRKQAIFIHIKGSHFDYARRYPDNFRKFQPATNSAKDQITADYDNTILYTDWILNSLITQLQASKRSALLVYASDHGENILDDHRGLLGHGIGNEYDLAVSSFIWASDNLPAPLNLRLAKLKDRADQPISISSLPHTLLGITGVLTNDYNSAHDLMSDTFIPSTCPYLLGSGYVPSFQFSIRPAAKASGQLVHQAD